MKEYQVKLVAQLSDGTESIIIKDRIRIADALREHCHLQEVGDRSGCAYGLSITNLQSGRVFAVVSKAAVLPTVVQALGILEAF